jgi:flagellin
MGLRIQTNIAAMNAHKNLGISNNAVSKSLERLSSGYRINRAADDAAGLAIAGKLRTNVKSFTKASENTAQANAMVQVAEGAMDQIENIVNRMKELATQSASTNTDSDGRSRLNSEFSALVSEIDRIANSTKYGSTDLLHGTFGAEVASSGATSTTLTAGAGIASSSAIDVSGHIGSSSYTLTDAGSSSVTLTDGTVTQKLTVGTGAQTLNFDKLGVKVTVDSNYDTQGELDGAFTTSNSTQNIQVGTKDDGNDRIALSIGNMDTSQQYGGGDAMTSWAISSVAVAQKALDSIDAAVTYVTEKRADLGAIQNRLGFAAANLATTIENTSAAESTIRDVDMASEMTSFTKNQILMQAGTAMLAQANSAPQQVLSLFG